MLLCENSLLLCLRFGIEGLIENVKYMENYLQAESVCDMPPSGKNRNSNIELYRIIVMLVIVAHHYVVSSPLMYKMMHVTELCCNNLFYYVFGGWGKTGIDCFVLITGYYMCKSKITLHKFLKLVLEVVFYSLLFNVIFWATGYKTFEVKDLLCFFPINDVDKNFTSCYIAFYLFIPFLNVLIRNLTKKQHVYLILLCLFIYSLLPQLLFEVSYNYTSWFCVLYFVSSYLRLYPLKRDNDTRFWRNMFLVTFVLGLIGIVIVEVANVYMLRPKFCTWVSPFGFVHDSNMPLSLIIAVSMFMWFKNIKIRQCKFINTIAASCFGVLLIHANSDAMRQFLWLETFDCLGHFNASFYWLYAIFSVLIVFGICCLIDIVRIKTIEKPLLDVVEKIIIRLMTVLKNNVIRQ